MTTEGKPPAMRLNMRLPFADGDVVLPLEEYMRQAAASRADYLRLLKHRLADAERKKICLELQISGQELDRQIRLLDARKKGHDNRRKTNAIRNKKIRADHARFEKAFRSYERIELGPLRDEFHIPPDASFEPRDVKACLAKQNKLSERQISTILKEGRKFTK